MGAVRRGGACFLCWRAKHHSSHGFYTRLSFACDWQRQLAVSDDIGRRLGEHEAIFDIYCVFLDGVGIKRCYYWWQRI